MSQAIKREKWVGVDLDGTFAIDNGWENGGGIGDPVPEMLERVKGWLNQGIEVRIVTARVAPVYEDAEAQGLMIQDWTEKHLGRRLAVTHGKDGDMKELWDDRAVQVVKNTGERVGRVYRDLPRN